MLIRLQDFFNKLLVSGKCSSMSGRVVIFHSEFTHCFQSLSMEVGLLWSIYLANWFGKSFKTPSVAFENTAQHFSLIFGSRSYHMLGTSHLPCFCTTRWHWVYVGLICMNDQGFKNVVQFDYVCYLLGHLLAL